GEMDVSGLYELAGGGLGIDGFGDPIILDVDSFLQTGGTSSLYMATLLVPTDYEQQGGTASFLFGGGTVSGEMLLTGGTLSLYNINDSLTVTGGVTIGQGGKLSLSGGTIVGDVTNGGTLTLGPRTSPTTTDSYGIAGDYTQLST